MNMMTLNNYKAKIEYDDEIEMFRGEILGLSGGSDFYASTVAQLHTEFEISLQEYLSMCVEKNIEPRKEYSGKFNVRLSPHLHEALVEKAVTTGQSLNQYVIHTLENATG
ncbi:MAG: type II toxin-antitoxin system HicB family antitoxin [Aliivibrio sp.]|uniref:type II toxin-antitoxin system HicB family antitoxin n=1 Tax=Aliivibrio sp. TaxID=1872443 RepID=UPI001A6460B5|nr:type II toxin-antitoxin system HicB family antitoxin [Aliivibrio sp.]